MTSPEIKKSSTRIDSIVKGVKNLFGRVDSKQTLKSIKNLALYDKNQLNKLNFEGLAPIHKAIETQNMRLLEGLIQNPKVDLNISTTPEGYTPLLFAIKMGNIKMVKLLLDTNRVDLEKKDAKGNNIFHLVADSFFSKRSELLNLLEQKHPKELKALLKEKNEIGETPYQKGLASIQRSTITISGKPILDWEPPLEWFAEVERLNPEKIEK